MQADAWNRARERDAGLVILAGHLISYGNEQLYETTIFLDVHTDLPLSLFPAQYVYFQAVMGVSKGQCPLLKRLPPRQYRQLIADDAGANLRTSIFPHLPSLQRTAR